MSQLADPADVYFVERNAKKPLGQQRSLRRAAAFAKALGIDLENLPPTIVVVGSKGKGTAAAYASATLSATGKRAGTLTSPGLLSHRERIRVDGRALSESQFLQLSETVKNTLDQHAHTFPDDGFLSPTGLFTLSAIHHFLQQKCDFIVLEAGLGGVSDEVSLTTPEVVIVTAIFGEHLGVIGNTVEEIALNKLGVIKDKTQYVITVPQPYDYVIDVIRDRCGERLITDLTSAITTLDHPIRDNANAGVTAALALMRERGVTLPSDEAMHVVWDSVTIPGRQSLYQRGNQTWGLDSAISGPGAAAALSWFLEKCGEPTRVLTCIPDGKDREGVMDALHGYEVMALRVDVDHLSFDQWPVQLPTLDEVPNASLGERVLALGTISFVGEVLQRLDIDNEQMFTPPRINGEHRSSEQ